MAKESLEQRIIQIERRRAHAELRSLSEAERLGKLAERYRHAKTPQVREAIERERATLQRGIALHKDAEAAQLEHRSEAERARGRRDAQTG